jgi:hypothetical protein
VRFDATATAQEIDAGLRKIAEPRAGWDDVIGWCAHVIRRSGLHLRFGFASFRHYCEERLGLPARTVEQRERLEKRLWESPALGEAKRQKVSYEKLRVLALLTKDGDIGAWTPRAHALTCIELRRRVTGEKQRQMRAARKLAMPVPRRLAVLLAAAAQAVRDLAGCVVPLGRCLAIIAAHFIGVWNDHVKAPRTWSQKVRARDKGLCVVPGCSHPAPDGHHVEFRSRGGSNDGANGMGSCRFHHHRCIHAGYMHVEGSAPDDLRFFVGGKPFTGGTGRDPTGG